MRALLDQASFIKHANHIGIAHGGNALRNDLAREFALDSTKLPVNLLFRVRIN